MSQSDYIKQKAMRVQMKDQLDNGYEPSTRAGIRSEVRQYTLANHWAQTTQPADFYTPAFPINHKIVWGMRLRTTCPNPVSSACE